MKLEATLKSVGEGNEGVCCAIVEFPHGTETQTSIIHFRGDINTLYDGICSKLGCPSVEIVYFDEEGDKIYLGKSQEELAEAIRCLLQKEMSVEKKEDEKKPDSSNSNSDLAALKEKLVLEEKLLLEEEQQLQREKEQEQLQREKEQEQLQREKEQQRVEREKQQQLQREKRAKQRENLTKRKENLEQRIVELDKKIGQLQEKKKELKEVQGDVHFKLMNLDNEDEIEQLPPPQQRERRLQQFRLEKERLIERLEQSQLPAENENRMRERLDLVTEKITHLEAVQTKTKQTRLEGLKKQHANVSHKLQTTPQNKPGQQSRLSSISTQLSESEKELAAGPVSPPSAPMEKKEGKEEQQAQKEKQQAQKEKQQAQKEKQQAQRKKQQAHREKQQAKQQAQKEKQQAQKEKQQAQKETTLARLQEQQTRLEARVQCLGQKQNKNPKQIETEKAVQQRLQVVQAKLQLINLQGAEN